MEAIIKSVAADNCPSPLDAAAKTQLITDCTAAAKAELTAQGFTEANDTLVVTIEEPPVDTNDSDAVVMWYDYTFDPASTAYRCRGPLIPGDSLVVGRDKTF